MTDLIAAAVKLPYAKAVLSTVLDRGPIATAGLSAIQADAVKALVEAGALAPTGEGRFALTMDGACAALEMVKPAPSAPDQRTAGARLTARLWG